MPEAPRDIYTASCNPPRRAKRSNVPTVSSKATATASDGESQPANSSHSQLRAILPMKPYTPRESATKESLEPPPPPAKRGRKPGPLSRSAREAQRRLNHSIIEKARRTKINDALATLKQLVPINYGQLQKPTVASDEEGDDDDEYEGGTAKAKSRGKNNEPKPSGKKEEKEFKLEILVRTVAFLQDLLGRVAALEASAMTATSTPMPMPSPPAPARSVSPNMTNLWPACPKCGTGLGSVSQPKKRKGLHIDDEEVAHDSCRPSQPEQQYDSDKSIRQSKIPRRSDSGTAADDNPSVSSPCREPDDFIPVSVSVAIADPGASGPSSAEYSPHHRSHSDNRFLPPNESSERLPPISSWMPDIVPNNASIDPQLFPPRTRSHSSSASPLTLHPSPVPKSYLPSPPASIHFDTVRSSTIPPQLNLGPVATSSMVGSTVGSGFSSTGIDSNASVARSRSESTSIRTPEDESAASLLLQISTSPTFRPVSSSSSDLGAPADPSRFWLHSSSDVRSQPPVGSHSGSISNRGGERQGQKSHSQAEAQTPSSLLGLSHILHNNR
ncbi:hypothetical protein JR316_0000943 [Psilocybe cubensis]|uniref:BHLH domain-containing protein n=2 Tax=Psilocybe cubensis TaxID=181762 RepID=A0A8H7YAG7_PSICU|nr:hypothetical protein JR316_0000943 [Psilocybe cubensis]KAH9486878.1 hypothetical protein JR316_0000943 [Psilocybe cubensis]